MTPTDVIPKPPTSSQPPETPPGSRAYTPLDSSRVHVFTRVETINCFEQALVKLAQVLEKVDTMNKCEDANPETTKHVEAEKPKTQASKLKYKLVNKVYVTCYVTTILLKSPIQLG